VVFAFLAAARCFQFVATKFGKPLTDFYLVFVSTLAPLPNLRGSELAFIFAFCLLISFCLPAYCLLPSAFCLLLSAFPAFCLLLIGARLLAELKPHLSAAFFRILLA